MGRGGGYSAVGVAEGEAVSSVCRRAAGFHFLTAKLALDMGQRLDVKVVIG